MVEALIGLGSNFEPEAALRAAVAALERRYGDLVRSSVYRGPASGLPAADYSNMVVKIATSSAVGAVRTDLASIETATGRTRADPRVCRLDLDLLVYGGCVDAGARLPRPGIFTSAFVLVPLAEIAPALVHPLTGQHCAAALEATLASSQLEKLGAL
jgi:2-amino-4-hydroxy-6-hydroxymethyldihydropteridine diphosphokinase